MKKDNIHWDICIQLHNNHNSIKWMCIIIKATCIMRAHAHTHTHTYIHTHTHTYTYIHTHTSLACQGEKQGWAQDHAEGDKSNNRPFQGEGANRQDAQKTTYPPERTDSLAQAVQHTDSALHPDKVCHFYSLLRSFTCPCGLHRTKCLHQHSKNQTWAVAYLHSSLWESAPVAWVPVHLSGLSQCGCLAAG